MQQQKQNIRALSEFSKAIEFGCDHWRVSWYLAQVAQAVGAEPVVQSALARVLAIAPEFLPAQIMAKSLYSDNPNGGA